MNSQSTVSKLSLTYEDIVERILELLRRERVLPQASGPTPWDAFFRLSDLIHENYRIPATTITPIMRRLLFALGHAAHSEHLVGVGTYVGYAFSWLLRNRADPEGGPFLKSAVGADVDTHANALARRNCAILGHGDRLAYLDLDGAAAVRATQQSIDLIYLDLDDAAAGKAGYRRVLEAAAPNMKPGALMLAHDACEPRFEKDMSDFHRFCRESRLFSRVWIFPVDSCGLSAAVRR